MSDKLESIKKLFRTGFFHVAGSNVINKMVGAITNIMIARLLGKYNYGLFGTAYNAYGIFVIFSGLGMVNAILLFCSEKRPDEEKKAFYRYGLWAGFAATVVLSAAMFLYGRFAPLSIPDSRPAIQLLSLLPLFDYVMQYFFVVLRSQKLNQKFAFYNNCASITYLVFGLLGAKYVGITGTIVGRYISYIIVILLIYRDCSPYLHSKANEAVKLSRQKIHDLWTYSIKSGVNSALNQILYLIDVALIVKLIKDANAVAAYKVAVIIPEGLAFIPFSIMIYLVPIVAEHNKDRAWMKENIRKLFIYNGLFNLAITATLFVLAPYLITLLWGPEYLDGLACFRILTLNYFFMATFRMPCTNILNTLHKVNFNLTLGICASILDIILDYVLILKYSIVGAAVATISTVLFISLLSMPYLIASINKIPDQEPEAEQNGTTE